MLVEIGAEPVEFFDRFKHIKHSNRAQFCIIKIETHCEAKKVMLIPTYITFV